MADTNSTVASTFYSGHVNLVRTEMEGNKSQLGWIWAKPLDGLYVPNFTVTRTTATVYEVQLIPESSYRYLILLDTELSASQKSTSQKSTLRSDEFTIFGHQIKSGKSVPISQVVNGKQVEVTYVDDYDRGLLYVNELLKDLTEIKLGGYQLERREYDIYSICDDRKIHNDEIVVGDIWVRPKKIVSEAEEDDWVCLQVAKSRSSAARSGAA